MDKIKQSPIDDMLDSALAAKYSPDELQTLAEEQEKFGKDFTKSRRLKSYALFDALSTQNGIEPGTGDIFDLFGGNRGKRRRVQAQQQQIDATMLELQHTQLQSVLQQGIKKGAIDRQIGAKFNELTPQGRTAAKNAGIQIPQELIPQHELQSPGQPAENFIQAIDRSGLSQPQFPGRRLQADALGEPLPVTFETIEDPSLNDGRPTNVPSGQIEQVIELKGLDPATGAVLPTFDSREQAEHAIERQERDALSPSGLKPVPQLSAADELRVAAGNTIDPSLLRTANTPTRITDDPLTSQQQASIARELDIDTHVRKARQPFAGESDLDTAKIRKLEAQSNKANARAAHFTQLAGKAKAQSKQLEAELTPLMRELNIDFKKAKVQQAQGKAILSEAKTKEVTQKMDLIGLTKEKLQADVVKAKEQAEQLQLETQQTRQRIQLGQASDEERLNIDQKEADLKLTQMRAAYHEGLLELKKTNNPAKLMEANARIEKLKAETGILEGKAKREGHLANQHNTLKGKLQQSRLDKSSFELQKAKDTNLVASGLTPGATTKQIQAEIRRQGVGGTTNVGQVMKALGQKTSGQTINVNVGDGQEPTTQTKNKAQANQRDFLTLKQLVSIYTKEANASNTGAAGGLKNTVQSIIQQGTGLSKLFTQQQEQIVSQIQANPDHQLDINLFTDTSQGMVSFLEGTITYYIGASIMRQEGRAFTNEEYARVKADLGFGGAFPNLEASRKALSMALEIARVNAGGFDDQLAGHNLNQLLEVKPAKASQSQKRSISNMSNEELLKGLLGQ